MSRWRELLSRGERLSRRERSQWLAELAQFVEAGVSPVEALSSLSRVGSSRRRELSRELLRFIEAGDSLAGGLARLRCGFHPAAVAVFDAAEQSGQLGEALGERAEFLAAESERLMKWLGALSYPVALSVLSIFLLAIPDYVQGGSTRYMAAILGPLAALVCFALVALLGAPWCWRNTRLGEVGRELLWRLPVGGGLFRLQRRLTWIRVLRRCLGAGLPMSRALHLSASATGVVAVEAASRRIDARILSGAGFAEAVQEEALFAPDELSTVQTGERSGGMVAALERLERRLEVVSQRRLAWFTRVTSTVLTVVILGAIALGTLKGFQRVLDNGMNQVFDELHKQLPDELSPELERALERGGQGGGLPTPAQLRHELEESLERWDRQLPYQRPE